MLPTPTGEMAGHGEECDEPTPGFTDLLQKIEQQEKLIQELRSDYLFLQEKVEKLISVLEKVFQLLSLLNK